MTQVIFATLPIAAKLILPVVEPLGIAAFRIFGAALAFATVKWSTRRGRVTAPADLLRLVGLSLLGVVLNQVLFLEGVQRTTAVHANILITTIPVFTLAIALLFIKLSLGYVVQSYSIGETSADPGGIPLRWAVKSLIPIGFGLLALQQLGALLRLFIVERQRRDAAHV